MWREVIAGVVVREGRGAEPTSIDRVLTPDALAFVAALERRFRDRRVELLARRHARQRDLYAGAVPGFLVETRAVRGSDWTVAPPPLALERRRVEITGPVDRKMMINALNSGADAFMADFEDALAPTWENVVEGQANVQDAVRGTLGFTGPDGRTYALNDERATLILRPRGWHLSESHLLVDGSPVSASLFDFGLAFFHNAAEQLARGAGPYFYLPKLESHLEARLWNDVFVFAQEELVIPRGSVRVTVLIETVLAAFEMDEILYELRDHAAGLNAGRWDYIFSIVKKFSGRADMVLPDRAQITMVVPFMRAYTELLVRTCHHRGAHAMGGMAAFVPNRRDAAVTAAAVAKVREDKLREADDGFDGTWVAHPDLVPIAMDVFRARLGDRPHQKERRREDVHADANALLRFHVTGGQVTEAGVRANIDVALQYLDAWLRGSGAVAIHDLMEDAATAEIARAQLWQWTRHRVTMAGGGTLTPSRFAAVRDDVLASLARDRGPAVSRLSEAAALLNDLVLGDAFTEFLTIPAYALLEPEPDAAISDAPDVASDPGSAASTGAVRDARRAETPADAETERAVAELEARWAAEPEREPSRRDYSAADVVRLRGSVQVAHTLADSGAGRLRALLATPSTVRIPSATTGADAARLTAEGVDAIRVSTLDGEAHVERDVPSLVRRLNDALLRADWSGADGGRPNAEARRSLVVPLIAESAASLGTIRTFELTVALIESGAAGVRFDDRLSAAETLDLAGERVLVPTEQVIRVLRAARLASDVLGVATVIIAGTSAMRATLIASDVDERDRPFLTGDRSAEGHHVVRPGIEPAIERAIAFAPYADLIVYERATPDVEEARQFADAVRGRRSGTRLAYELTAPTVVSADGTLHVSVDAELAAMGYTILRGSPSVARLGEPMTGGAAGGDPVSAYRARIVQLLDGATESGGE